MALELQIGVGRANDALKQVERSIESLRSALDRLGSSGSQFSTFVNQVNSIRVDPGAGQAIKSIADAAKGLASVRDVTGLANSMARLAQIDFQTVASGMRAFATALASVRVPPALAQIVVALNQVSTSAHSATTALNQTAAASRTVGSSMGSMSSGMASANNILSAFGISLGAVGFGQFIQGAYEATSAFQTFNAQMGTLFGGTNAGNQARFAADQFEFLRRVARETGQDIQALMPAYSRWAQTTVRSGVSARDAAGDFYRLSAAFRVFGLSGEQATGAFRAFEQMMSKGKVQMEELRGQLGDRGVPAVNAMATALGVTSAELNNMMQRGQVTSREVSKLIDVLYQMAAPGLPAALATLSAQMGLLSNAATEAQLAFGNNFFAQTVSGFKALTDALGSSQVQSALASIGSALGTIASGFLNAVAAGMIFISQIVNGFSYLASTLYSGIGGLTELIFGFNLLTEYGISLSGILGVLAGGLVTFLAVGLSIASVSAVWYGLGRAVALVGVLLSPMALKIYAIVAAVGALAYAYAWLTGNTAMMSAMNNMFSASLAAVTGTALDAAGALNDTAAEYNDVSGAATNATNATRQGTDAARRYAEESRNINTALRNENAERTRLDRNMRDLINSQNGHTTAARENTGALNANGAAANGAAGSQAGLSQTLNGNVGSFNAATSAAMSYGAAMSWVTSTGDRVPVLQAQGNSYGMIRRPVNQNLPSTSTNTQQNPLYDPDAKTPGQVTNSPSYDPYDAWQSYDNNTWSDYSRIDEYSQFSPASNDEGKASDYVYDMDSSDYGYMRRGGYVGRASESRNAPASLWNNAARFADGGYVAGAGEVPIIAHNNEAVVPLPDGRSIPVSFTGGEFIDSIRAIGVVYKNESDRWIAALEQQTLVLDVIANKITVLSSAATPSTPTPTTPTAPTNTPDTPTPVTATRKGFFGYGSGGGGGTTGADNRFQIDADGYVRPVGMMGGGGSQMPMFAAGTPNTSSTGNGAFMAMLHPDEAVIPLPDGRSVPVDLRVPADMYSPLRRAPDPVPATSSGGSTGSVVVNMYINTPDVASFKKSEDQILTDLQTKMDRARQRIGFGGSVDDPTVRKA